MVADLPLESKIIESEKANLYDIQEVRINTGWSDYVFADDYKLRSLTEVADFIKANKHLPGVEPASVVEKEGADIGATQTKLLEKIEELTLYLIEVNRQNKELQLRVLNLEEKIKKQ